MSSFARGVAKLKRTLTKQPLFPVGFQQANIVTTSARLNASRKEKIFSLDCESTKECWMMYPRENETLTRTMDNYDNNDNNNENNKHNNDNSNNDNVNNNKQPATPDKHVWI
jgi:hypothetical protein